MITLSCISAENLTLDFVDDLRDASRTYYGSSDYAKAFDNLFLISERDDCVNQFLYGDLTALALAEKMKEWLFDELARSLFVNQFETNLITNALESVRPWLGYLPEIQPIDDVDPKTLITMAEILGEMSACTGIGPSFASELLRPLRPRLFVAWDREIAAAYGLTLAADSYHQFLSKVQSLGKKARKLWNKRFDRLPLEHILWPSKRRHQPSLATVISEWNYVRIAQKITRQKKFRLKEIRYGMESAKEDLRQLLHDIDAGKVQIQMQSNGAGSQVSFVTDNGWKLLVFNDCGCWDYIEVAEHPDGRILDVYDILADKPIEEPKTARKWGLVGVYDFSWIFDSEMDDIES
jgi:hypothetical protein